MTYFHILQFLNTINFNVKLSIRKPRKKTSKEKLKTGHCHPDNSPVRSPWFHSTVNKVPLGSTERLQQSSDHLGPLWTVFLPSSEVLGEQVLPLFVIKSLPQLGNIGQKGFWNRVIRKICKTKRKQEEGRMYEFQKILP